jgi:hypothetical protein
MGSLVSISTQEDSRMYTLLLLTAMAQPVPPPPPGLPADAPGGIAPEQVMASIDAKGKLTIVHVTCNCYGPATQETTVEVPAKKDEKPTKVKVKISSVVMTTAELPAKHVEAYTAGGERIETEKLAKLLAKERTVLVAMDGKKVDPFHLQLYKDDTIVLVPPPNTLNMGGLNPYSYVPVPTIEDPLVPPLEKEKREKDRLEDLKKLEKEKIEEQKKEALEREAIRREQLERLKKLEEQKKQEKNP